MLCVDRIYLYGRCPCQKKKTKKNKKKKKAPLWTHPRFSLSSVHSLWCACRKRSSKTCAALPTYNFLMKSPNTFWQTYFLRKRKSLLESRRFFGVSAWEQINKKRKPQVCQNFPFMQHLFLRWLVYVLFLVFSCWFVWSISCCERCEKVFGLRRQRFAAWVAQWMWLV